jgi:6-pyruvoyltetrahydropterin/6-carboxytetrahydropterin synthase
VINKNRVRITKEFSFEMSHFLKNHLGGCNNIHGHSYKLFVTISGYPCNDTDSPQYGMLIDFGELKKIVNKSIIDPLDHSLMVSEMSFKNSFLEQYKGKIIVKPFEPTCENLVSDFADKLSKELPKNVELYSIKLYETSTSYCEWYASDNELNR